MHDESNGGGARRGHWENRDGLSRWVADNAPTAAPPPRPAPREAQTAPHEAPAAPREAPAAFREAEAVHREVAVAPHEAVAESRPAVDAPGRARGGRGRSAAKDKAPQQPPADPVSHAREICLNLLTTRPRTRAELRTQLLNRGVEEEIADRVLNRLDDVGLVDDAAFAEQWVRSRHTYHGMARRALSAELRRKGVADELAAEAVSTLDSEAEEARARELVRKRMRGMGSVEELTAIRRLVGMLARKGYAEGMAYRVVRDELRNAGNDTELLDDAIPE